MEQIKLGVIAKSKISGFTGVVTEYIIRICGSEEYKLQPQIQKEGKWVQSDWVPASALETPESEKDFFRLMPPSRINAPKSVLGEKAEDIVSGLKGTVTAYYLTLGGNEMLLITAQERKDNGEEICEWFPVTSVKILSEE